MSNLSDLLPSGAGGKSFDFVASGTLPNGQAVGLKSDGKIEAIAVESASQVISSNATFKNQYLQFISSAFDSNSNKVVIVYMNDAISNDPIYAIVGTVSGTSISFGTEVLVNSRGRSNTVVFDSLQNKVVVAYQDPSNSNYGYAKSGTISGTSISFGTATVFRSTAVGGLDGVFDTSQNRSVIAFFAGQGQVVAGYTSGTSIYFGTHAIFYSGSMDNDLAVEFDSSNNKLVFAWKDVDESNRGNSIVGSLSNTTFTFVTNSFVVFDTNSCFDVALCFDSTANKIVLAYGATVGGSDGGYARIGTVSGSSISWGGTAQFATFQTRYPAVVYDSNANKVNLFYSSASTKGLVRVCTVSGTSLSLGSSVNYTSVDAYQPWPVFDSSNNIVVIPYSDFSAAGSLFGQGQTVQMQNSFSRTNSSSFVGITEAAISDTATGTVTLQGGINTKVTGLTIGSTYYVQDDGTLGTGSTSIVAGEALSATSINLVNT